MMYETYSSTYFIELTQTNHKTQQNPQECFCDPIFLKFFFINIENKRREFDISKFKLKSQ